MQKTASIASSKNWNLRFSLKKVEDDIVIKKSSLINLVKILINFGNNKFNNIVNLVNMVIFLAPEDVSKTHDDTFNTTYFLFLGTMAAFGCYAVYKASTCTNIEHQVQETYSYKQLLLGEKPYGVSDFAWAKAQKSAQYVQELGHKEFSTFGTPWDERTVSQIVNILDESENVAICETEVEKFKVMVESAQPRLYYYNLKQNANSDYIVGKFKIDQFDQNKIEFFNSLLYEGFSYVNHFTEEKFFLDHLYACGCTLGPRVAAMCVAYLFYSHLWLKYRKFKPFL